MNDDKYSSCQGLVSLNPHGINFKQNQCRYIIKHILVK